MASSGLIAEKSFPAISRVDICVRFSSCFKLFKPILLALKTLKFLRFFMLSKFSIFVFPEISSCSKFGRNFVMFEISLISRSLTERLFKLGILAKRRKSLGSTFVPEISKDEILGKLIIAFKLFRFVLAIDRELRVWTAVIASKLVNLSSSENIFVS